VNVVRATLVIVICVLALAGDAVLFQACGWARDQPHPERAAAASAARPIIDVKEPRGVPRTHWPLSAGVPFPAGMVTNASQLRVGSAGNPVATQARVLSHWPDGSARWVLIDWQADVPAHAAARFPIDAGAPPAPARAVAVTDQGDRVEVDTGPLQFAVPKKRFAILSEVRLNGAAIGAGPVVPFFTVDKRIDAQPPSTVKITEPGPLRARIEMRGHYAAEFDYVARIDAFANQPFVRVLLSFEQHSPQTYTDVHQIGVDVPLTMQGKLSYSIGQESGAALVGAVPAAGFSLVQGDNHGFQAGPARRSGHAAGWVDLHDGTHGVAVAARFFWQEYPQSFALRPSGLTYNLWAPEAAPAKIGMGAAKTHEMVLYFHGASPPAAELLGALATPLVPRVDPQWTVTTAALRNALAPGAPTSAFLKEVGAAFRRYEAHADEERWDDSGQARCPDAAHERPRVGFYGMLNWGDWNFAGYHDTTKGCDAWGNLEYDMTQVLALAYASTGDVSYYERMVAAARHFMDVDRIYYQRLHPNWVGMNHPKNPLHFAFELGGVDLGHTWTEGLLSYYALTGDERGLEAARGIADYLVHRLRTGSVRGNPRQWGWPQIALVAAYDATGTSAYKDAAREYAKGGMAAHAPEQIGEWKIGILAEALAYTHSVTQDPAIREWLARYATAVAARGSAVDPRYVPAVAYVGRISAKPEYTRLAAAAVPRLRFGNWGKPFTIAGRLGFSILAEAAREETHEWPH